MRLVILTALTALLLVESPPMAPRAHAEEIKYKARPRPPADDQTPYKKPSNPPQPPAQKPPVYKPPTDRPPTPPPPSRHEKQPPEPHQPPDWQPPTHAYPPPIGGGWIHEPPCLPPPCATPPVWDLQPVMDPPGDGGGEVIVVPPSGINRVLAQKVNLMHIEGFTGEIVVGSGGRIEFDQAYNAGGYFDIGSATEAFTAWAIYRLVGDNKLQLGTTVGELFPFAPAEKSGITIEQLLGNTSGLGNTFAADGEIDRDTAVRKLLAQPLAHAPDFNHSDDGYVILAAAISVASGMRYERYLMDSGIVSLDMTSTLFWADLRTGHGEQDWGKRGSGGIFSTAKDLYTWASTFAGQPANVTDEIMRPRVRTDQGVGIGYGWFSWADQEKSPVWTSGTGESDDNVRVVVYPTGRILAVTSDRYHGDVPWSERVANTLDPVLRGWTDNHPIVTAGQ